MLIFTALITNIVDEELSVLFTWIPPVNFYLFGQRIFDWEYIAMINFALIAIYGIIVLLGSKNVWKHIFEQEKYALSQEPTPIPPPESTSIEGTES